MKIEKKTIKTSVFIFAFIFILITLVDKYFGHVDRFSTAYIEPSTWHEIYLNLPRTLIFCLIGTIGLMHIINVSQKQEEKDIENARKRIKERDKMEKEQKTSESDIDKE